MPAIGHNAALLFATGNATFRYCHVIGSRLVVKNGALLSVGWAIWPGIESADSDKSRLFGFF